MLDLTDELNDLKGISELLWILSGFRHSDLTSMSEGLYLLSKTQDDIIKKIEKKTEETEPPAYIIKNDDTDDNSQLWE